MRTVVLFAAGYFLGAVGDKQSFVKETVDRVVPKKNEGTTINFREEVERVEGQIAEALRRNNQNNKTGAVRAALEKAQKGEEA